MITNDTNKKIKNFLPFLFLLLVIIIPVLTYAEIIPSNCGNLVGGKLDRECGYYDLLTLINNIIDWIIKISIPVAAGVFAWAGFTYMTTGISDQKAAAKSMLWKVFWGFAAILSAWIIVTTITNALLSKDFPKEAIPVEGAKAN